MEPLFVRTGSSTLQPQATAGSPWQQGLLHGGPPSGLLAHVLEAAIATGTGRQLVRVSVDLLRAVPAQPLTATVEVVREGHRLAVADAWLSCDGEVVAQARGLALRPEPGESVGSAGGAGDGDAGPDGLEAADVVVEGAPAGFHTSVEVRAVPGRQAAWFRLPVALVHGETVGTSSVAVALADFGNALAHLRTGEGRGFINTDLTVSLLRSPQDGWIRLGTLEAWSEHGVGMTTAVMHDRAGRIGTVVQTLLIHRPVPVTTFGRSSRPAS